MLPDSETVSFCTLLKIQDIAGDHACAVSDGICGVLLSSRAYRGELMAAPGPSGLPLAKSNLSLSYMEDTGWYIPDYTVAVPQPWGRGLGNAFATGACSNWPALGASNYVCPQSTVGVFDSTQNNAASCTSDRVAKGVCQFKTYPGALPAIYQYFGGAPYTSLGGLSVYGDYCPLVAATTAGDCRLVANTPTPNPVGEEMGPASRCFAYTKLASVQQGCFKHVCVNGALWLKLESVWQLCPDGGAITSTDLTVTVACPRTAELCDVFATAVPPTITLYSITSALSLITVSGNYPPIVKVALEVTNFLVPSNGSLRVSVGSVVHSWYTLPAGGANLTTSIVVSQLPQGTYMLVFDLVDAYGNVKATASQSVTVALQFAQWVATVIGGAGRLRLP